MQAGAAIKSDLREKLQALCANIERVIFGKSEVVKLAVVTLLARGHLLIEDIPGVGKTTLAMALAKSLNASFKRIQFTPDLLPSDIVGVSIYESDKKDFTFKPGPIFASIVLADEINRTTPRTQSALLEAMNDFQVTVDGVAHPLPRPFMVVATQNPLEFTGTYPLPESQLDRFLMRVKIGYPSEKAEEEILVSQKLRHPIEDLRPCLNGEDVDALQGATREVAVEEPLRKYILDICRRTRQAREFAAGVSPRGALMLYRAAQACALLNERAFCTPDDVKQVAGSILAHRIIERATHAGAARANAVIEDILHTTPVPL